MSIIKRDIATEIQPYLHSPEAIVITGMRRTGKTTLLQTFFDTIESTNKLFLDMESPANQAYFSNQNYDAMIDTFRELGLRKDERMYIFLDEIQSLATLPSVVKYLIDHYQVKFFLSGSASFYIKNLFTESLSGRKFIFELFPFSFSEFLRYREIPEPVRTLPAAESTFLRYAPLLDEYLRYGGFPSVVAATSQAEKERKLEDVFASYWTLEVERLSDFRKKDQVRNLIFLLMTRTGTRLDITKLSRELGIAKNTVDNYLTFLEDTYLIHTTPPFSRNLDVEIRGAKKIYFSDTGLINRFSRVSDGSVFENLCYTLLRHHGSVRYHQKKTGQEIDFIVNEKRAYEAKISATEHDVTVLKRRASALGIADATVISRAYAPTDRITYAFLL